MENEKDSLWRRITQLGRAAADMNRHDEKVDEILIKQLPELLSDGQYIFEDPQKKVRVKIQKHLDLPTFKNSRLKKNCSRRF